MHKLTDEQIKKIAETMEAIQFINALINRIAKTRVESKRKENKMKATYEATIKVKVVHEIDTLENIKDNNEFAQSIVEMICDEATTCGAVAICDVLESRLDVR